MQLNRDYLLDYVRVYSITSHLIVRADNALYVMDVVNSPW